MSSRISLMNTKALLLCQCKVRHVGLKVRLIFEFPVGLMYLVFLLACKQSHLLQVQALKHVLHFSKGVILGESIHHSVVIVELCCVFSNTYHPKQIQYLCLFVSFTQLHN